LARVDKAGQRGALKKTLLNFFKKQLRPLLQKQKRAATKYDLFFDTSDI
jgi:hypothetical protein